MKSLREIIAANAARNKETNAMPGPQTDETPELDSTDALLLEHFFTLRDALHARGVGSPGAENVAALLCIPATMNLCFANE
jgi:hypothetical protein